MSRDRYTSDSSLSDQRSVDSHTDLGAVSKVLRCKNKEIRKKAETCLADWGIRYALASADSFGLLARPPSPKIRAYAADLQSIVEGSGTLHIRFPRGAGKTTWCKIAILWGLATGRIHYAVIFAASATMASDILRDVYSLAEGNKNFGEDYPEVAWPIIRAEGITQRFAGQHFSDGSRPGVQKTARHIRFPTVPGFASSGAMLMALGAGSACRGLVRGSVRPDLILLDDIQTRKDAESSVRTAKLCEWIDGDVRGLAGTELIRIAMTSTPIRPGDLSERYADTAVHPEWRQVSYPLLISDPKAEALWEEYDDLFRNGLRENGSFADATSFYESHREKMDEGGEVLDPEAYDHRLERSAIQHARNSLLGMGRRAFDAEYQLKVAEDATVVAISARLVSGKVNGTPRYQLPPGTMRCCAFLDVNSVAGITYCVTAFGPHQTAAVIDYGRFPGRGRLVEEGATIRETESTVAKAIAKVIDDIRHNVYLDSAGRRVNVGAVWVDNGYLSRVVNRVTLLMRKRGFAACASCKGYSNAYYLAGKNTIGRGEGVDERQVDGETWFAQNSDMSKEAVQAAFLGLPLQPGTVSLWGADIRAHWDFADEIASETLTDKAVSQRGVAMYRWSLRPGAANHYLDALSGTFSMARWFRFWESEAAETAVADRAPTPTVPRKPRRRIHSARAL